MVESTFVHFLLSLQLQLGSHVQMGLDAAEVLLDDLRVLRQFLKTSLIGNVINIFEYKLKVHPSIFDYFHTIIYYRDFQFNFQSSTDTTANF